MIGIFPESLRTLRLAMGLSQARLAKRMYVSPGTVGHLETGHVRATPENAVAADRALGTTPLLATLLGIESKDDDVRRRALINFAATAVGVAAADPGSLVALGEVLRRGLHEAVSEPADWQAVIDDLERRLVLDPTPTYGQSLMAQLALARQCVAERPDDVEPARAAAHLSLLYGLWMGNAGRLAEALGWYRTGAVLADHSGDPAAQAWTLGRAASRGLYELMPVQQVRDSSARALAVTARPTPGALEARSALVHVAALTGDLDGGRHHLGAMRTLVDLLPAVGPVGPAARTASFAAFLEARAGTLADAERAQAEAELELAGVPLWLAEARVYFALAMARAGDARGAAAYAVEQLDGLPWQVHTLSLAVADLLREVPRSVRTDEVELLRAYAGAASGPWETLG